MNQVQKILIVDDKRENLTALRQVLRGVDAGIIEAAGGNEALAATLDHTFALAILDVMMPGMSGYELAEHLRGDEATRFLPIIFITAAYPDEQHMFSGYEAGGADFIVKPFAPEVLLAKVRVFLELDRQRLELQMHRDHLERLVAERTRELARELAERTRAEEELRRYREHLEELVLERTAELESFSYTVSHDLRAPLRAISGFSGILLEEYAGALASEGRHLLDRIMENTKRMGHLIDDLLSFSRAGRSETNTAVTDMTALARGVVDELLSGEARERIRCRVDTLPAVKGDVSLLRQVWVNLLSNAVKFTLPKENGVIEVGSTPGEHEEIFHVKDTGVGFDMQHAHKLFGIFQRLHSTREFDGTGVGLAIVKRIVERHGGRVWAEGTPGEGATFYFSLPGNRPGSSQSEEDPEDDVKE